jgi:BirA family biotin operon repressor/biotin-[acetyl-CoA-carboxylase] ligase
VEGDRLLPSRVRPHLATASLGRRIYYYPETGSTNDVAVTLARGGEAEGTIVVTDYQRLGRGRQGREWQAPRGRDLLVSVILRPPGEPRSVLPVTLALSLALSAGLSRATGLEVGVKWPNDLVTVDGKLGGILAEATHAPGGAGFVVVGFGINVNAGSEEMPGGLRLPAVSCRSLTGETLDRAPLLADLLGMMEVYYRRFCADGFGPLVSAYEERMLHRGRPVRFVRDGTEHVADVAGVEEDGALRVRVHGSGDPLSLYNEEIEVLT